MAKEEVKEFLTPDESVEPKVAEPEAKPVVKSENVSVPRKTLEKLMERMDRAEYALSKSRLAHYDEKNATAIGKNASVSVYEGKIVTAWETTEDLVEKNPTTGVWMERQTLRLHFLDSMETEDVPYQQFVRRSVKKDVKVKSETKLEDGRMTYSVETIEEGLADAKGFDIDIVYIN